MFQQEQNQFFQNMQGEISRDWQEKMYNEYFSPSARFDELRGLGMSNSAALMALNGISPSMPSASAASGGIASMPFAGNTFAEFMQSFQNSLGQFYDNELKKSQATKTNTETQYMPAITEANIQKLLADVESIKGHLKIDQDTYDNVTVPIANSTLGLNSVELEKKQQEMENLKQEFYNLKAQFHNIQADTKLKDSQANLSDEQAYTETFKRADLAADAGLKGSQAIGQNIENGLNNITLGLSEKFGIDVRMSPANIALVGAADNISRQFEHLDNVFQLSERIFHKEKSILQIKSNTRSAFDMSEKFWRYMKGSSSAYDHFFRQFPRAWKKAENWINHNTKYGM